MSKTQRRAGLALLALSLFTGAISTGANAVTQATGPATCATEIRVASKTTGETYHRTSMAQYWYKGYKNNSGATSYTGFKNLDWVATDAPKIASSGYACR